MKDLKNLLDQAAEAVWEVEALLLTAGAGMGVDSGLPDFRGTEGFWRADPAVAKLGLSFPELANPAWFKRSPALAWAFYGHRLNLYRQTGGTYARHFDLQFRPGGREQPGCSKSPANVPTAAVFGMSFAPVEAV